MSDLQEMPEWLNRSGAVLDPIQLRMIVCEATRIESVKFFRKSLKAIILTGSMARDEASFVRRRNSWELYGDAEFMIVLENSAALPPMSSLTSIRRQIEDDLRRHGIHCSVDLSTVRPSYFKRLPAHIFTYELKHCGRLIWGDGRVLDLIPNFSADELSREDAWRLLCNRLIEQLGFIEDLSNTRTELTSRLFYATIKLYLDMATSYLVFARAYEPTYRARAGRLRTLAKEITTHSAAPFSLVDFAQRVDKCTELKSSFGDTHSDRRLEFWLEALCFARNLWHWEAVQLTKGSDGLPVSVLFDRLSSQLRFMHKARGWASVAKRNGGLKSWRDWPRWARLGMRITPRYLVYRVGIELIFQLPSIFGDSENGHILNGELPKLLWSLPARDTHMAAHRRDWQVLADAVLQNYRYYLSGTVT